MKRSKVFIGQEVFLHVFCSETYEVKGKICSIDSYTFTVILKNGEEFVTFHFGSNRDDSGSFEIVSV